jgi:glutamine phosphoribosylpyrophosphate amidotransferase
VCGVIGFVGKSPDVEMFKRTAKLAGMRGPHGHGFAFSDGQAVKCERHPGPMHKDPPAPPAGTVALIGQGRLATSGRWWEVRDHQPLVVKDVAVAHNGNVYNADALARRYKLDLQTNTDSEVIAHLILQGLETFGVLKEAVGWTCSLVDARSPMALLVLRGSQVVGFRRGGPRLPAHPLFEVPTDHGYYLCSWRLPGSRPVTEDVPVAWDAFLPA